MGKTAGNPACSSTLQEAAVCSLLEAAVAFQLDQYMIARLRRRLAGKHLGWKKGRGRLYAIADMQQAIREDRAEQARRDRLAARVDITDPCPVCGAPIPRRWMVDRCWHHLSEDRH